ncbi:MAG: hypothetical protein V1840_01765 [Candidatus Omnitrophota bacterium]
MKKKIARLIRPAGYYNIKAKRLKNFIAFFNKNYAGSFKRMKRKSAAVIRKELLGVNGIGPETADSILLYALGKPVFVVDAYTRRIMSRHHLLGQRDGYEAMQRLFMECLPNNAGLFNEYHALLVRCAKEFCKNKKENCKACPLNEPTTYACLPVGRERVLRRKSFGRIYPVTSKRISKKFAQRFGDRDLLRCVCWSKVNT